MFDLVPMLLSSVASFLFPIFASYKALKTSDPAQLTPWLMYWVVFSCCLLVESWFNFILFWVPFYGYIRLLFLLYLILPQTQGARLLYEEYVHPFLQDNESHIDEFIASAHNRLKAAGISYLKQAIEFLKVNILGLPPSEPEPVPDYSQSSAQSYTSSLLARFSVPSARFAGRDGVTAAGTDFYNFLAGAVASAAGSTKSASSSSSSTGITAASYSTLIPSSIRDSTEKMSFLAAQRERLNLVLGALDREAQQIQKEHAKNPGRVSSMSYDGNPATAAAEEYDEEVTQRPPSGLSMWSALSKSKSETDFEKIEGDVSGAEDDSAVRRRKNAGGWGVWGWGGVAADEKDNGHDGVTGK